MRSVGNLCEKCPRLLEENVNFAQVVVEIGNAAGLRLVSITSTDIEGAVEITPRFDMERTASKDRVEISGAGRGVFE